MGVEYKAIALIGIEVDQDLFLGQWEWEKVGQHDFPLETKFHPGTGKKLWERVQRPHPAYDSGDDMFGEFKIIREGESDRVWLAVCYAESESSRYGGSASPNVLTSKYAATLEARKQRLKELLEPLGYWREEAYGLHAVLYVSV